MNLQIYYLIVSGQGIIYNWIIIFSVCHVLQNNKSLHELLNVILYYINFLKITVYYVSINLQLIIQQINCRDNIII